MWTSSSKQCRSRSTWNPSCCTCIHALMKIVLNPKIPAWHVLNPLSTGQSKIGRRWPISLDYHCVNISQRIFINKISLERSFHYLNVDTLFLEIGQEMTLLEPFEVTQLIDFALDRSTSVTCGRDFAHSITMVTRNVRDVYSKWRQGSKLSTGERTNFIAAPQTKNDWILCFSSRKATSFTQDYVS